MSDTQTDAATMPTPADAEVPLWERPRPDVDSDNDLSDIETDSDLSDAETTKKKTDYDKTNYPDFRWDLMKVPTTKNKRRDMWVANRQLQYMNFRSIFEFVGDPEAKGKLLADTIMGWVGVIGGSGEAWDWFYEAIDLAPPGHPLQTTLLKCLSIVNADINQRGKRPDGYFVQSYAIFGLWMLFKDFADATPTKSYMPSRRYKFINQKSFLARAYVSNPVEDIPQKYMIWEVRRYLEDGHSNYESRVLAEELTVCAEKFCKMMIPGEDNETSRRYYQLQPPYRGPNQPKELSPERWLLWKQLLRIAAENKSGRLTPRRALALRATYAKMDEVEVAHYAEHPEYPRPVGEDKAPVPSWLVPAEDGV